MEVKAILRYLKISPTKVRIVANVVKGFNVDDALDQLRYINKKAAIPLAKLIKSAIANAEHNFSLDRSKLYIKNIIVNEGPMLKRWMPRAFGRATLKRKRTSHIEIILQEEKSDKSTAKKIKSSNLNNIKLEKK